MMGHAKQLETRFAGRTARPRRGAALPRLLLVLLLAGGGYGGYAYVSRPTESSAVDKAIFFDIERGDFELAVTERGEIESAGDVEIRSEVKTKSQPGLAILRIVPEGTYVDEGDFLVELDSSALQEERTLQQIAVNTVEASVVEAKNNHETAKIAKREYIEGTFVQEKETLESELFVAEEELSRAEEYLKYSRKLAAKGYVNDLQLQADKFAVEKAKKEADAAKTKLRVLEEFTRAKTLKELESQIVIAKAKWESEKNSLALEVGKLRELDDQIAKCTIRSPGSGVVKYAHLRDRRGSDDFLVEEGAQIRERQVILRLPDATQMQVVLNVNESLIQYVKPGMVATVEPIGFGDQELSGVVERVNQYAEPTGWRKANVKEYKAYVRIDEPSIGLRSGMTASVTIRSAYESDVLKAPVQAVYSHGDRPYCFVLRGGKLTAEPVVCGPTNDSFYVVESGLEEADRVAVNPWDLVDLVSLPELAAEADVDDPAARRPVEGAPSGAKPEKVASRGAEVAANQPKPGPRPKNVAAPAPRRAGA